MKQKLSVKKKLINRILWSLKGRTREREREISVLYFFCCKNQLHNKTLFISTINRSILSQRLQKHSYSKSNWTTLLFSSLFLFQKKKKKHLKPVPFCSTIIWLSVQLFPSRWCCCQKSKINWKHSTRPRPFALFLIFIYPREQLTYMFTFSTCARIYI